MDFDIILKGMSKTCLMPFFGETVGIRDIHFISQIMNETLRFITFFFLNLYTLTNKNLIFYCVY